MAPAVTRIAEAVEPQHDRHPLQELRFHTR
jgi:hypothetical protein